MIKEEIKKTVYLLKMEYAFMWVICCILMLMYEYDILPQGIWAGDAQMEYVLQCTSILLTVLFIPLSLRLFNFTLVRRIQHLSTDQALVSYRRWSEIRLAMLLAPTLFSLSVYYWTMDTTGLLCAAMTLLASCFCIPGHKRLINEMNLEHPENDSAE